MALTDNLGRSPTSNGGASPDSVTVLNNGFSLIELMVVLAIIGVLGGIALPIYSDYGSKTQVTRAYSEISMYTSTIELLIANGKTAAIAIDSVDSIGFSDSTITTVVFGTFEDAASSTITATLDGAASSAITGATIVLRRTVDGIWTCTTTGNGGDWQGRFRPAQCL